MAFDLSFTKDVVLPLAQASYNVMEETSANLPDGFEQTVLIQAADGDAAAAADTHAAVTAMIKNTKIFGLMGRNNNTHTAFISLRGSQDVQDWLHNLDFEDTDYTPIAGFGRVHAGFLAVYSLIRGSISAGIAEACQGCTQLMVTGHSLGAAVALLAAPDIFWNMSPNLEPRVVTFAGPRVGLPDFASSFNKAIEACFRVVNFLDLVPLVPPAPYLDVGAAVDVDSGGEVSVTWRHSLEAYRAGLTALTLAAPAA